MSNRSKDRSQELAMLLPAMLCLLLIIVATLGTLAASIMAFTRLIRALRQTRFPNA